jgi:hypothetical protein
MDKAADLRHRAGLYKRLAQIRTSGGHSTDLLLLSLADELDREAAELEDQLPCEPRRPKVGAAGVRRR